MDPKPKRNILFSICLLLTVHFAAGAEPPFHPLTNTLFAPGDVDRAHPVYITTFDPPDALADWRLEGGLRMSVANGALMLESRAPGPNLKVTDNHLVCWLTKEIPADFLLEFRVRPQNRQRGLNIVFFSARGLHGESIFAPTLQPRSGLFSQYHSGDLNNYHVSYWAGDRGTANVRKNKGFALVATGPDLISAAPAGSWQTVQLAKRGGTIRLAVDGILSVGYDDLGVEHGPVWNHSGWIGLRQMAHTVQCEYDDLKIFPLQ